MTHLRQCCCIFTKRTVWTDGMHYMTAANWAKHARLDALIVMVVRVFQTQHFWSAEIWSSNIQ